MPETKPPPEHAGLRVIAVIKLVKAVLLVAVGLGSFRLLNHDMSEVARSWAKLLRIDPENHLARWVIIQAAAVQPSRLRHFGDFSLLLALDQVVEGIGLWYNQAWAKYLLLGATSVGFVWESYTAIREPSSLHFAGVAFCVVILLYLAWMFWADRKKNRPG